MRLVQFTQVLLMLVRDLSYVLLMSVRNFLDVGAEFSFFLNQQLF